MVSGRKEFVPDTARDVLRARDIVGADRAHSRQDAWMLFVLEMLSSWTEPTVMGDPFNFLLSLVLKVCEDGN